MSNNVLQRLTNEEGTIMNEQSHLAASHLLVLLFPSCPLSDLPPPVAVM